MGQYIFRLHIYLMPEGIQRPYFHLFPDNIIYYITIDYLSGNVIGSWCNYFQSSQVNPSAPQRKVIIRKIN